jgi:broad specificity phosphatase PhoE
VGSIPTGGSHHPPRSEAVLSPPAWALALRGRPKQPIEQPNFQSVASCRGEPLGRPVGMQERAGGATSRLVPLSEDSGCERKGHLVFGSLPILVVVPHADAGDRTKWTSDQDLRPLTDLGRSQAAMLALAVGRVDAIVSSPARRCVETVEPIAAASDAEIELNDDLRELTYVTEHESWDAWRFNPQWRAELRAAAGLGRVVRTLARIGETAGAGGRVAISAHGDLVPLFALLAAGYFRVPAPVPAARGGCYEIDPRNAAAPIRTLGALVPRPPA